MPLIIRCLFWRVGRELAKQPLSTASLLLMLLFYKLDLAKKQELPILLAAPTGRRQTNEINCSHSGYYSPAFGEWLRWWYQSFDDYLDVDSSLWMSFLWSIPANQLLSTSNSKILIVGDADQLPSVSPGQLLNDLLKYLSCLKPSFLTKHPLAGRRFNNCYPG